MAVNWFSAARL